MPKPPCGGLGRGGGPQQPARRGRAALRRLSRPLAALALLLAAASPPPPPPPSSLRPPRGAPAAFRSPPAAAAAALAAPALVKAGAGGGGGGGGLLGGEGQGAGRPPGGTNASTLGGGGVGVGEGIRGTGRRPAVPLRPECLDIVRRAGPPVDLAREDAASGAGRGRLRRRHPHRGATDEDGTTLGYVPDERALRRDPPPFRLGGKRLARACSKRDSDFRLLTEKVLVEDLNATADRRNGEGRPGGPGPPPIRILCLIYTVEQHHSRLPAIRETWGQRCDGFFAASNKTDASLGAVNIPHAGPETYLNMWQKVRSIWSYVYDTYYDKYDWFHIGGDDMYLIVDNLRLYLGSEEIRTAANGGEYLPDGTETTQVPLFLGRRFARKGDGNVLFNSGGPGYTLNRAALKVLVARGMPHYYQHDRGPAEDVKVARVLRQFGVFPYETKDETGAERYMPFMPGAHYDYKIGSNERDYDLYGIGIREGADCCSARSVAFHYASPGAMRRMHALLYGHCGPARARQ